MAEIASHRHVGVPTFKNAREVQDTYAARRVERGEDLEPEDAGPRKHPRPLYFRDGGPELTAIEEYIGFLIGAPGLVRAYPYGMSAIVSALESAYPTKGTTAIFGQDHYTETLKYAHRHLAPRGVNIVQVDSGSPDSVRSAIERHLPDIIFLETVTNGTTMPVLDVDSLFQSVAAVDGKKPLVILDNTLATPTLLPPSVLLGDGSARVAVVESGTKSYALNYGAFGLLYSNDGALLTQLSDSRITVGYTPAPPVIEIVDEVIPSSKEEFDYRNLSVFRNTLALARAAQAAGNDKLFVVHPNLETHQNHLLAQAINPEGVSPVFYIYVITDKFDQFALTDMLNEHPGLSGRLSISQSFGFEDTRIYPYYGNSYMRVAGGAGPKEEADLVASELNFALRGL